MYYILENHEYINDIQTTIQIFYPNQKYTQTNHIQETGMTILSALRNGVCGAYVYKDKELLGSYEKKHCDDYRYGLIIALFYALKEIEGVETPWGAMTGIRPTKKIHELLNQNYTQAQVLKFMEDYYLVSSQKAQLALDIAKNERKIICGNDGSSIALYIGIPFCPTKCLYCSFASYPMGRYADKADKYLNCLFKELDFIKEYTKNFYLETIYIGGGTPTSLNAKQLERLLNKVAGFNVKDVREYTVEAGRPDTLDIEKLKILKSYGVSRISINPQTLNDKTLERIGRSHSVMDFYNAFELARAAGHKNINTDLILGLPCETLTDVENTFLGLEKLSPEGMTVHTLAVKRASALKEQLEEIQIADVKEMKDMLQLAQNYSKKMNMIPYYMYRQKNMTGNFENVGYSVKGCECVYNVQIMAESQAIIAAGAGAVSKTVDFTTDRIERIFNVKNVDDYMARIDEMIYRKKSGLGVEA